MDFLKNLKLVGIGYKAALTGNTLELEIGMSHNVRYTAPEGITFEVERATKIIIKGADKQKVGQVAAKLGVFVRLSLTKVKEFDMKTKLLY